MSAVSQPAFDPLQLEGTLKQLIASYESYQQLCFKYANFLKRYNTSESQKEAKEFDELNLNRDSLVSQTKTKAEVRITQLHESRSHRSVSGRHSMRSSKSLQSRSSILSQQLIKARADAEAAKVQAAFAQKKVEMGAKAARKKAEMEAEAARKKAEMEVEAAEMKALEKQCEHATALSRLNVLEQEANESERDCGSQTDSKGYLERITNYVLNQSSRHSVASDATGSDTSLKLQLPVTMAASQDNLPIYTPVHPANASQPKHNTSMDFKPVSRLNAYAPAFVSNSEAINPRPESTDLSQFAKYMLRRELTKTGLTKFDDKPENYRGWKSTFKATMSELDITATEELDLLIRWLGPQSTERIKRLKAVHIDNPAAGLSVDWNRLERSFGSPEAIEDALFKRLQDFPKISGKDNLKFQELSDLLLELQLAKADIHLPGLSYLDTARGVNPIVSKLPYSMQERWASLGSKYKEVNQVSFPPFSYFCEFIRKIADTKNDPSFFSGEFNPPGPPAPKPTSTRITHRDHRHPVSVKRTEVLSAPTTVPQRTDQGNKIENPNCQCPLHNKPHPLRKCIGFRKKPLQERKELLREFGICEV